MEIRKKLRSCAEMPPVNMESVLAAARGTAQQFTVSTQGNEQKLKFVVTDTMGIVDRTIITDTETAAVRHKNWMPMVELNFMLAGTAGLAYDSQLPANTMTAGDHQLLFNPSGEETNQVMHGGTHRLFSAHLLPDYMAGLLSGYLPELTPLAEKIANREPFALQSPSKALSQDFKYFFTTFWSAPLAPGLGKLYFDAKILDLLCRQCEILIGHQPKDCQISKTDLEKVYHAQALVLERLGNPLSLSALSLHCGLNEFKLKKYFKQIFGTTVFGMLQEERLKAARYLIKEGEKNISQIAYELGYAHPQHFHRAFKKRFGLTPTELLK
jgi:AraC-like DNA-binding protein